MREDGDRRVGWRAGAYALAAVGLWPFPVLGLLHAEAAAVVAGVAYGVAGLGAVAAFRRGERGRAVLRREFVLLSVPLVLLTATLLWRPNCGYLAGLGFFALFPGITVVFAVAVAYLLTGTRLRRPGGVLLALGVVIAVAGPLYDLGFHPQFYTYNHVFGGVLGPIYDEELAVRPGLFAFRALTLLWAALAWAVGLRLRGRGPRRTRVMIPVLALWVGGVYAFAGPLGITTPAWYLQRALGGTFQTAHFDLYFDPAALTPAAVQRLALDHEYRYARLTAALEVRPAERVASYLYPDPETKARLTGARLTNVAPVWLARPQVHVLLEAYGDVFPHELAHVFSRSFGLPVINASIAVGLVEGLAVALEPPDGRPTPHEQVAAAALVRAGSDGEVVLAEQVAATLSPLGFWTGRGAVSYTTMGSFVRYLLDAYGPAPFRAAYPLGAFEAAYGKPVEVLAAEWERHVLGLPVVSRATAAFAVRRFAVPSLFEVRCPHYVPAYVRRTRAGVAALEAGAPAAAQTLLTAALAAQPTYTPALAAWARATLALGAPEAVVARLEALDDERLTPALLVSLGDAYALRGAAAAARAAYEAAADALPPFAHETRTLLGLRRAVAGAPAATRALVEPVTPAAQAAALAAVAATVPERGAALGVLRATRLADADRPAEAFDLLRRVRLAEALGAARSVTGADDFERQRLVWLAALAERAGDAGMARSYAAAAERAYRTAGDLNAAARLADVHARLVWSARNAPDARSPIDATAP